MYSKEELELQYSPRMWTKRTDPEKVIPMFVEFCESVTNSAKKSIPCDLDISYGNTSREKIDIYGTDLASDAPILIYVHGGYWQLLSKDTSGVMANPLYKHGIKLITLGYNLCPNISFSILVREVQKGMAYCLNYAKQHKSRGVYLCGHSAGGHLIATAFQEALYPLSAEDKNIIKGVIFVSGIFNLIPIVSTTVNKNLKLTEEEAKKCSPLLNTMNADKNTNFFVVVGEYESSEFHKQSTQFYNKLKNDGYNSELIIVDEVDHFNIMENLHLTDNNFILRIVRC